MTSPSIRLLVDSGSLRLVEQVRAFSESAEFELLTYEGRGAQAVHELLPEADAAYMYQDPLPGEAIRSAPALRFIQKHGLNTKNIDVAAATERGIPVATAPLFRNVAVAEHAMALMLACAHKIIPGHKAVEGAVYREMGLQPIRTSQRVYRANWPNVSGVVELMGASVGIIGLGDIGMEVARRCRAFGMTVFYHQRQPHAPDVEEAFQARFLPFEELLRTVDYLVLILPYTSETAGLIGEAEFLLMKPSATLINVARGGVVDEDALVHALRTGSIAMAGLDVFREEPLPAESPLRHLANVVLSPHTGGGSYRSRSLDHPACLANILRFFKGERPEGVINLKPPHAAVKFPNSDEAVAPS